MHCVMWRSSFFSPYQSGIAYHYVVVCSVVCGLRSFNFESSQVFFVGCRCVWVIERVGGAGLKGSLWTLGIERLSKPL